MKTSLKNKALILSLAALVMAGTGCERRGRVKKEIQVDAVDPAKAAEEKKAKEAQETEQLKSADKSAAGTVVISSDEIKNLDRADIECPLFDDKVGVALRDFIDVNEAPTAETLKADVVAMTRLRVCLGGDAKNGIKGYGVNAVSKEDAVTKITLWAIDGDPLNDKGEEIGADGKPRNPHSPLFTAFDAEAKRLGSSDTEAAEIMKKRIGHLQLNARKMIAKYSEARLPSETPVGQTLSDYSNIAIACDDAIKTVDTYWTFDGGKERADIDPIPMKTTDDLTAQE